MACKDTKTRYQSVYARHQVGCAIEGGRRCNCTPKYFGVAFDRETGRHVKTSHLPSARAAKNALADLHEAIKKGDLPGATGVSFGVMYDRFVAAARDGIALNKRRRPYRPRAWEDLESVRKHFPDWLLRKDADKVKRGDIQRLSDELRRKLSTSRVKSVVNAVRSAYTFGRDRELARHDPAQQVRLPAKDEKPRDRVVTPAEFIELLEALGRQTDEEIEKKITRSKRNALRDAVPFALAAYGTARRQEIETLDWPDVDLDLGAMELAADDEGRKPGGSWRIVPLVAPLWKILRQEWIAQGRPTSGRVCPPRRKSKSGRARLASRLRIASKRWRELGLEPIGFQEARHTAATWLDHAGVSPKVSSLIMGHKTPEYQPGAARITLQIYTHMLPGELERARELLDEFLAERLGAA